MSGKYAQIWYTAAIPSVSASCPKTAAPRPPTPNAKAEEYPRNHTDPARYEFLRVHNDGRERRGENEADRKRQRKGPLQVDVRQQQRERHRPDDREPDDALAAEAIAERTTQNRADRDRGEKRKEADLRIWNRDVEALDQIKREVVRQAGEVHVLRKYQHDEYSDAEARLARRDARAGASYAAGGVHEAAAIPLRNIEEHRRREQRKRRKEREARLSPSDEYHGCSQRAERGTGVAADLKNRLGESVSAARGSHPRDTGSLRMKDRRSDTERRRAQKQREIVVGDRNDQEPGEREQRSYG